MRVVEMKLESKSHKFCHPPRKTGPIIRKSVDMSHKFRISDDRSQFKANRVNMENQL